MGLQDPRLSSSAERERSAAKDKGTGGQCVAVSSVSNSPLAHNPFVTLSRIKCERYIFLKKCVRSSLLLILFPHVYLYRCICSTAIQHISVLVKTASVSIFFQHRSYFEEKWTFHSLFIFVLVNTASVSIFFSTLLPVYVIFVFYLKTYKDILNIIVG